MSLRQQVSQKRQVDLVVPKSKNRRKPSMAMIDEFQASRPTLGAAKIWSQLAESAPGVAAQTTSSPYWRVSSSVISKI